jgi:Ran GTPase-activating protein (RanGAP) involved in mRNA processing and transport
MSCGFDYHLSEAERKKVERMVPLHQAKIHMAFRADIVIDDKRYRQGAVALSEHLVVLAKKAMMGKGFAHVRTVHLLDIYAFSTSSSTQCKLMVRHSPEMLTLQLASDCCLRFARVIVRNYYVITKLMPATMRFQFRPHEASEFPLFDPAMSPSQIFQFCYNAQCSYFDATYEHSVTQFFHGMVVSGNGIADLTRLPLRIIEPNFGHPLELQPLFTAMMFCPVIYGVCCYGVTRPDIVRALAPLVLTNSNLALVDFHGCRSEIGIIELAEAVTKNSNSRVVYWDLSYNRFRDISPFCAALSATRANVFYLNLSWTGLNAESTAFLMHALETNRHLWRMRHLLIAGAQFTEETAAQFCEHIEALAELKKLEFKTLDISDSGYIEDIVDALSEHQPPLEALYIGKAAFAIRGIESLLSLLSQSQHLKVLGLRGAQIRVEQLAQVITAIGENDNITSMYLDLSRLKLSGKQLPQILEAFRRCPSAKWTRLNFDENDMVTADLIQLVEVLKQLPGLKELSIGGNFAKKEKQLASALQELLAIPRLTGLALPGTKSAALGEQLIGLLRAAKTHATLTKLDVSGNRIGDNGVNVLIEMMQENDKVIEYRLDGSRVTSLDVFVRLLETLGSETNEKITSCPFPMDDFYALVQRFKDAKRGPILDTVGGLQKKAQDRMQINQAAKGIHSDLAEKGIIELNELLDNVTLAVYQTLDGVNVTQHAALAAAFGLPFPHQNEVDQDTGEPAEGENPYGILPGKSVQETIAPVDGLATLQFNSLLIRRPEARGRVAQPQGGKASIFNTQVFLDSGVTPTPGPMELPDNDGDGEEDS